MQWSLLIYSLLFSQQKKRDTMRILSKAIVIVVLFSNVANSYTVIDDNDVSGETWSAGTYFVTVSIYVNDDETLTIQAGAVVKFEENHGLTVNGTLDVNGTEGNNVVFTAWNDDSYGETITGSNGSPVPGAWHGIYLNGSSAKNGIGEFDWCRIRYAGSNIGSHEGNLRFYFSDDGHFINSICEYSDNDGLNIHECSPTISNSTFANNNRYGLSAVGSASIITDNTFTDNTEWAAKLIDMTITSYSGNLGTGNGFNGLGLAGTVNSNQTWSCGSSVFPIILNGTVNVNDNYRLTLSAGTIIKAASDSPTGYLRVRGTIDVNGTSASPVILTSIKDDTYGGDTNGDGSSTSPSSGDWNSILLDGTSDYDGIGEFDWCRIRYGGSTVGEDANIKFYYSDAGYFTHSICEYSENSGLWVVDCSPTFRGNSIENNDKYGIHISNNGTPDLGTNNINDPGRNIIRYNDSGNYQVYNNTSNTVNAYYNFWGYTSEAEVDAHIFDDDENTSNGEVYFDPFFNYIDTETASMGSPIYFNEIGDGHDVDMVFSSLTGSGDVTVRQGNDSPSNAPCTNICGHHYDISEEAGITTFEADLTFHYTNADATGYTETHAFFGIAKYNSSTETWQWLGGAVDAGANTVTVSGVESFSKFALYRRIFGDVNGDGYVNVSDFQRLGDVWHNTNSGEFESGTDDRFFNYNKTTSGGNQIIDVGDFQVFGDCWHNGVEP